MDINANNDTMAGEAHLPVETHPWAPFIPEHARILIMGTFPPRPHRWRMNFYYPNPTNDFWRMMGIIFYGDALALYDQERKMFRLDMIKALLEKEGIAMHDTGYRVKRLKGNASDKFLEIIEPVDLERLLAEMPECTTVATTGEKAARVIAELTGTDVPRTGAYVDTVYKPLHRRLRIWRMPSTSRAYPLPVTEKAALYSRLFLEAGVEPGDVK